jgi:hypothetical protein
VSALRNTAAVVLLVGAVTARADAAAGSAPPAGTPTATGTPALATGATPTATGTPALAVAVPPAPAPAPASARTTPPAGRGDGDGLFGVQLGAGLPDGLALSATLRPLTPYLRLHAGLSWNYFGLGVNGGVTALPVHARFTPTLTLEAGTYFGADWTSTLDRVHIPQAYKDAARSAGMTYFAALGGFETGDPDGLVFFLRAGLAHLSYTLGDVHGAGAGATTLEITNPGVSAWVPAAVLGLALHFR